MQRKSFLIAAILLVTLAIAITSDANDDAPFESVEECVFECVQVLAQADAVITDLQQSLVFQGKLIENQRDQLNEMQKEIERRDAWYKNPWLAGALGLLAGALVVR